MAESQFDDEFQLRELIIEELDNGKRDLLLQVHRLDGGCAIMRYLDAHPNQMLTIDDLAFHLQDPAWILDPGVRRLVSLGLLRRIDAKGTIFFGLAEEPATRAQVHQLFNWQRSWHTRLARVENLVDGQFKL